ncbi:MAG: hypothetical protein Ct9H300mP17_05130 [Candidatus Nitrosopelagicus sp.]|nr:MAG: hypothetical protein Ct9H300mP17_05130 [Candidatus Nitrosopelagicus sp.]
MGLDNEGNRIGFGAGFYENILKRKFNQKFGLSYSKQIVKTIPISDGDVKMGWIITEKNVIKNHKLDRPFFFDIGSMYLLVQCMWLHASYALFIASSRLNLMR